MHNNYIMYIAAMWLHSGWLDGCFEYWCSHYE